MIDHRCDQTPVRDQGDRPTCVGFAVSAAHEWMASPADARSEEDAIWAAHTQGGDPKVEGTTLRWALAGLTAHGHASNSAWPYDEPPWPAHRPPAAHDPAQLLSIPVWNELAPATYDAIETELMNGLAVLVSLWVVRAAWRQPGGIISASVNEVRRGSHAVLAVGALDDHPGQRIIIKNSWGPRWGAAGYGFVMKDYLDRHLRRAFLLGRP